MELKDQLYKILDRNCPDLSEIEKDFLSCNVDKLKKECRCPFCYNVHRPYNGTGAEDFEVFNVQISGLIRFLLRKNPVDIWLQRTAVPFHDWMTSWGALSGVTFEQLNRVFKELVELDINYYYEKKTRKMWYPRRTLWRAIKDVLLDRVDDICKYAVGSRQTMESYEINSCKTV